MNNLSDDDDDDDDDTCPNLAYESDDDEDYTDKKIRRKSKPKKKKKKVKKDVKPPLLTETEIEQQLGKLNVIEQGGEINFINIYDASYLTTDVDMESANRDDQELLKVGNDPDKLDDLLQIPREAPPDGVVKTHVMGKDEAVLAKATECLSWIALKHKELILSAEFVFVKNFVKGIIFQFISYYWSLFSF